MLLDRGTRHSVPVAGVAGPLKKAARACKAVELGFLDEEVVHAIDLARARSARRNRYGNPGIGDFPQQTGHQRAFAST